MVPGSLIEDASFVVKNFIILRSSKFSKKHLSSSLFLLHVRKCVVLCPAFCLVCRFAERFPA